MNRLKILLLALLTVCVVGVAMTSSASAEVTLPEFMTETSGSATAGEGELTSSTGTVIKCTDLAARLSFTSRRLGLFTFDFLTCTARVLGQTLGCKSLGDTYKNNARPNEGGTILVGGEWHLLRPFYLIWLLLKEVHIECSNEKLTITALILVRGNVLGTLKAKAGSKKEFEIAVKTTERGGTKQEVTEYENDEGAKVKAGGLESSVNGGAFSASGENSPVALLTTEANTELLES